jgi:hypothetical protein
VSRPPPVEGSPRTIAALPSREPLELHLRHRAGCAGKPADSIHTVRWMPAHPLEGDAAAMDESTRPMQLEIRIRGHLGETMLTAFPGLDAALLDGETVLTGLLPDQAALFGVLAQIEAFGLELLEVRRDRQDREATLGKSGRMTRSQRPSHKERQS